MNYEYISTILCIKHKFDKYRNKNAIFNLTGPLFSRYHCISRQNPIQKHSKTKERKQ